MEELLLWDALAIPYSKQNDLIEKKEPAWGTYLVRNVTVPTLTVYAAEGDNSGIGVVVIPGGGYEVVAMVHEGYEVAEALARQGITAAVLKYRLPDPKTSTCPELTPLADARQAIKMLRQNASRYGIQPAKVGVVGFSAGSHLSTVASLWKSDDPLENPAFSGLIYGVTRLTTGNRSWLEHNLYFRKMTVEEAAHNRLLDLVDSRTPPAFVAHAYDDTMCDVEESIQYAKRLHACKVPVEMHLFGQGGHGFGVGHKEHGTDRWPDLFVHWLKTRFGH